MPAPTGSSPTVPGTPAGGAGNGFKKYFEDLWTYVDAAVAAIFPQGTGAWASYTPTFGSGWTVGNGTVVARYTQTGKTIHGHIRITLGSTSSITSANTGISLPVAASDAGGITGSAEFFDTSASTYTGGRASSSGSTTQVYAHFGNGTTSAVRLSNTVPVAPANGDVLVIDFTYQAA